MGINSGFKGLKCVEKMYVCLKSDIYIKHFIWGPKYIL